jgi:hypothetical protein
VRRDERCVFCNCRIKRNDVLRLTPHGRTIAFDARRGRLWIVCDNCGRWNLTPLDTRADAIEECAHIFDNIPERDTTGGILRAAVPGLRMICVREPAVYELDLWRHCARIDRRTQRHHALGLVIMGAMFVVPAALVFVRGVSPVLFWVPAAAIFLIRPVQGWRGILRCVDDEGHAHSLRKRDLATSTLALDSDHSGWSLLLRTREGPARLRGDDALRALRVTIPGSVYGVTPAVLKEALHFLHDPRLTQISDVFAAVATEDAAMPQSSGWMNVVRPGTVHSLPLHQRVALEIATTELLERPAALDEARQIAAEWATAEEVADISDNLFLSDEAIAKFEQQRRDEE